jgi:hypothetical protein
MTKLYPILIAFLLSLMAASLGRVSAEPRPAFDRDLAERFLRAQEQQARSLADLARAAQKCSGR